MTTKDRLKEFLSYKKMGRNKFEEMIQVSSGYVSSKSVSISSDAIEKTCLLFPDLNPEWLITGKGNMLKSSSIHSNAQNGNINTNFQGNFNDVRTSIGNPVELDNLKEENAQLRIENTSLKSEVERLKQEVERLTKELLNEKERLIKSLLKE